RSTVWVDSRSLYTKSNGSDCWTWQTTFVRSLLPTRRTSKPRTINRSKHSAYILRIRRNTHYGISTSGTSAFWGGAGQDGQNRYWPKADICSCTAHVRFRG